MLARRFTIVCLLSLLFALGFASLVTAGKSDRRWAYDTVSRCTVLQGDRCGSF